MKKSISQIYNTITESIFFAFIFLIPLQTRYIIQAGQLNGPWEYGTYALYVIDIILIILFLLSIYYKKTHRKDTPWHVSTELIILPAGILLISFLSLYWSRNQELGFYYLLRLIGVIMLLFIIYKIKINFNKLSWAFVSAGVMQSILAIIQFYSQKIFACKWLGMAAQSPDTLGVQVIEGPTGRWLRAYGTLPHPNILGGFLVFCLLLCVYLYVMQEGANTYSRLLTWPSTIMISTALFLTFSRSAAISLIIALIFLTLIIFWKLKKLKINYIKIVSVIILTCLTLTLIYPTLVLNRFNQINRLEKKSITERAEFQQESLILIKKYWPIGVGIGNYTQAVYDLIDNKSESYKYQPVHNIYLLIFSEIGLFGLLIFMLIIINSFKKINLSKTSTIFLGTILISIITAGFFDHYFWSSNFGLLLCWLPIGLMNEN